MESQSRAPAAVFMIKKSMANYKMVFKLAKNDFKTKYAGSYFGILWAFVQPVVTILLYWFVFEVGFTSRPVGDYPFVLWLTSGLVPWFFFSDAWNGATSSLLEYSFLVKKVVFDIEILPAIKVISAFFINLFFTLFTLLVFAIKGYWPTVHTIQILYCLLCITMLSWGLSYFTSAVVVFVRDLAHLLSVVLSVLMWLTPIMWDVSMVAKYPWLYRIMHLNPVFYIVQCYRDSVFAGKWFWENTAWTVYFWALTLLLFLLGASVFRKLKPHFADVL